MGAFSRNKGARRERELVNILRGWGADAYRVPLSGATERHKGDVVANGIVIELKSRKSFPDWLGKVLDGESDLVCLWPDRGERIWLIPDRVMRKYLDATTAPTAPVHGDTEAV